LLIVNCFPIVFLLALRDAPELKAKKKKPGFLKKPGFCSNKKKAAVKPDRFFFTPQHHL